MAVPSWREVRRPLEERADPVAHRIAERDRRNEVEGPAKTLARVSGSQQPRNRPPFIQILRPRQKELRIDAAAGSVTGSRGDRHGGDQRQPVALSGLDQLMLDAEINVSEEVVPATGTAAANKIRRGEPKLGSRSDAVAEKQLRQVERVAALARLIGPGKATLELEAARGHDEARLGKV